MEKSKKIGIVQPEIRFWSYPDIVQSLGLLISNFGFPVLLLPHDEKTITFIRTRKFHRWGYLWFYVPRNSKVIPLHYATGCAMMIRKEVLETVGLFNEDIFFWNDDTEFCLRALKYGFLIACIRTAIVYHMLGTTREKVRSKFTDMIAYEKARLITLLMTSCVESPSYLLFKALTRYIISGILLSGYYAWFEKENFLTYFHVFLRQLIQLLKTNQRKTVRKFFQTFRIISKLRKCKNSIKLLSLSSVARLLIRQFTHKH